jgi:SAM-dependent methyltransferase
MLAPRLHVVLEEGDELVAEIDECHRPRPATQLQLRKERTPERQRLIDAPHVESDVVDPDRACHQGRQRTSPCAIPERTIELLSNGTHRSSAPRMLEHRSHDAWQDRRGLIRDYDGIGRSYATTRRADPRIAAAIDDALGDAESVVNVGAGTGSYEPVRRAVLAIEPSATMIGQRPPTAAPAIQAPAEALPIADDSFDAALAVNTVHHWRDVQAGLRELRRVARKRIVIFLRTPHSRVEFWLADYFPALVRTARLAAIVAIIESELRPQTTVPVPLPHDCTDGMFSAYWGRPEMYLSADVRRNISNFALAAQNDVSDGLARLRRDLESGEWDRRHGELRKLRELDLGHRLFIVALAS